MIPELGRTVLTALLSIIALFLVAKLMGHRQMAQMDVFDYITGITIGSIAAELATELEKPLKPLIAMLIYGMFTVGLSIATSRWPRSRKYVNGTPTIILDNGKLYRQNMKKAKLDLSEFLMLCRQAGYFDLSAVQTAVYEYNGRLSFLPTSARRPTEPEDLNLAPEKETIFTEIIMDGRVLDGNLHRMGRDMKWLEKQLHAQDYTDVRQVFLGLCDDKGNVTLYKKDDK